MKHLITLVAALAILQVQAQTLNESSRQLIRDNAAFWAQPHLWSSLLTRGAGLELTHALDSVVSKDLASHTTQKIEVTYNSKGHTSTANQYDLDSITGALTLQTQFVFDYADDPAYATHMVLKGLNEQTQQLETTLEMNIQYDASNRIDSVVISLEDPLGLGGFGPYLSVQQVYDGDKLVQSRQWIYFAIFGSWIPASITDLQYDDQGRLIDRLVSVADLGSGSIVPDTRTIYEYNGQGLQSTVTDYQWVDPNWEATQRTLYTYYPNDVLAEELRQQYSTGEWFNNLRTVYPVENVSETLPVTSYLWDPVEGVWNVTDSTVSLLNPALPWSQVATPDELSLLSLLGGEVASPFDDENASSINEVRFFYADTITHVLAYSSKDIYYYSLIEGSSVDPVLPSYITVAPNPAQSEFSINLDSETAAGFRIFNATGTLVEQGQLHSGKNTINGSGWPSGIYYVQLRMADGHSYIAKQIME